jgi:pyridoxal phosphate enzyme (YggS family)
VVDIGANYQTVVERVNRAALKVGRDPGEIKILGAAKAQEIASIEAAIGAGLRLIGENYVQEAVLKRQNVTDGVEWHMIGHLQRNKVKTAVGLFDVIESVDNSALARELDSEGRKRSTTVRILIEVNLSGERAKSGIAKEKAVELLATSENLRHISVEGLMTIPRPGKNAEESRGFFRELRQLRDELSQLRLGNVELKELSMGMTNDFEVAIEEGATIVRIGTAIFGERKTRRS